MERINQIYSVESRLVKMTKTKFDLLRNTKLKIKDIYYGNDGKPHLVIKKDGEEHTPTRSIPADWTNVKIL